MSSIELKECGMVVIPVTFPSKYENLTLSNKLSVVARETMGSPKTSEISALTLLSLNLIKSPTLYPDPLSLTFIFCNIGSFY